MPIHSNPRGSSQGVRRGAVPAIGHIEPVRLRQVNLSGLARPRSFHVDPEDGIDGVRLTALRFGPTASRVG